MSMFRKLVIGALGAMAVLFSTTAFAQGTAADAKAMLDKTVAAIKAAATIRDLSIVGRFRWDREFGLRLDYAPELHYIVQSTSMHYKVQYGILR